MTKEEASDQMPNYQLESTDPARNEQPNNPLHSVKLADILEHLVQMYGWDELGNRINIRCFNSEEVRERKSGDRLLPIIYKSVQLSTLAINEREKGSGAELGV
jgi:hypothetical protein